MFWRKEKEQIRTEIEFLRGFVKDLTDRLMAMQSPVAHAGYHAERRTDPGAQDIPQVDILSKINGMDIVTEKDRREKEEAIAFAHSIIGGGPHA